MHACVSAAWRHCIHLPPATNTNICNILTYLPHTSVSYCHAQHSAWKNMESHSAASSRQSLHYRQNRECFNECTIRFFFKLLSFVSKQTKPVNECHPSNFVAPKCRIEMYKNISSFKYELRCLFGGECE